MGQARELVFCQTGCLGEGIPGRSGEKVPKQATWMTYHNQIRTKKQNRSNQAQAELAAGFLHDFRGKGVAFLGCLDNLFNRDIFIPMAGMTQTRQFQHASGADVAIQRAGSAQARGPCRAEDKVANFTGVAIFALVQAAA